MVKYIYEGFMVKRILLFAMLFGLSGSALYGQWLSSEDSLKKEKLDIKFKGDAKIEVGSVYAGLSFHHSYPVPQRISFYYPAANSIDHSTDYWFRDTTFVMDLGLKFGSEIIEWLNKKSLPYDLTPFSVVFKQKAKTKDVSVSYQFTKNKPAMVISYTVKNKTKKAQLLTLYLRYALSLNTCHSWHYKEPTGKAVLESGKTVTARFSDGETQNPELFILSGTQTPTFCQVVDSSRQAGDTLQSLFPHHTFVTAPAANYIYTVKVPAGQSISISEVFGSCTQKESGDTRSYLVANYTKEVQDFESSILREVFDNGIFKTGDDYLDRSVKWSQAMLAVQKHYIDGDVTPMPCPAEYNFYFTHDVLLTDLAAVNFDLPRVKNDLNFIMKHSNDSLIIPHAYYWKDTAYVTEFADRDNWNNFWFVIACSEYAKHSGDKEMTAKMFSYVEKALTLALKNKGADDLMWSQRPDWWDIGSRYGQRSYMTLLAIRAIRSYLYVSTVLEKEDARLVEYEQLAGRMSHALIAKLWSEKDGFLMSNTDPGVLDEHIYSGSLLAAHYGLLDKEKISRTVATARKILVDPKVGVSVVYPMDFDKLTDLWHFVGNEVGAKYYYINGGIWPHANSWYALALIAAGNRDTAYDFIKNVMTINGIIDGPNGQPAMYEVRNANHEDPKSYGTIDKPQFMWAAGWYLYSLYSLFGIADNEWNITFSPWMKHDQKNVEFAMTFHNKKAMVKIQQHKNSFVVADGKEQFSYVLPESAKVIDQINIRLGDVQVPYLEKTNSILNSIKLVKNEMSIVLRAFKGHKNETSIITPVIPTAIFLDGKPIEYVYVANSKGGEIIIHFTHAARVAELKIVI